MQASWRVKGGRRPRVAPFRQRPVPVAPPRGPGVFRVAPSPNPSSMSEGARNNLFTAILSPNRICHPPLGVSVERVLGKIPPLPGVDVREREHKITSAFTRLHERPAFSWSLCSSLGRNARCLAQKKLRPESQCWNENSRSSISGMPESRFALRTRSTQLGAHFRNCPVFLGTNDQDPYLRLFSRNLLICYGRSVVLRIEFNP